MPREHRPSYSPELRQTFVRKNFRLLFNLQITLARNHIYSSHFGRNEACSQAAGFNAVHWLFQRSYPIELQQTIGCNPTTHQVQRLDRIGASWSWRNIQDSNGFSRWSQRVPVPSSPLARNSRLFDRHGCSDWYRKRKAVTDNSFTFGGKLSLLWVLLSLRLVACWGLLHHSRHRPSATETLCLQVQGRVKVVASSR